jgi:ribonuclease D
MIWSDGWSEPPPAIVAPMLIDTSPALANFCDALRGAPYIAVDTEFMREKSYHARLCLVQVAHGENAAAIDPLAPGIDLRPLADLLLDPTIVKVLHSATQDLEIFLEKTGAVPAPVFDTQIAASVCGLGEQPGYAKLVASLLGEHIDKASQNTDWSLRPLSDRQLGYALGDVTHLCAVYEKLVARLEATGRGSWVKEEMEALLDPARYRVEPWEAWQRIKLRRPKRKTLVVLRELAAWREEQAMERDIPRGWVARDEALVEIANHLPQTGDELTRVRSISAQVARGRDGTALLAAVERALASPEDSWPELPTEPRRRASNESLVVLLQALLQLRCETHDVAPSVVARRAELDRIATETDPDVPALKGWRRVVFGADALELCAGRLALSGHEGRVVDVRGEA